MAIRETRHLAALTKLQIERDFLLRFSQCLLVRFADPRLERCLPAALDPRVRVEQAAIVARFTFFAVVSPPLSFVPWRGADRIFSSLFRMIPTLPLIRPLSFRRSILSLVVVVCSRADLRVIASLFADRGNFEILLEERKRGFIIKAYCVQWLRENIALAIKFFSPNISLRIFIYASRG